MTANHGEVEAKYDVDPAASLPQLDTLAAVSSVAAPVRHQLVATYFDTEDLTLATAGITLRRRTGGDDAGWHLKLPSADNSRYEVHLPLGRATKTVPKKLRDIVEAYVRSEAMMPIATVQTDRTMHRLLDPQGRVLAEVADDMVQATATGGAPVKAEQPAGSTSWREWEVELVHGDRCLPESVAALFGGFGVTASPAGSKLARALDGRLPARPNQPLPTKKSTEPAKVVQAWLFAQVEELRRQDALVRADAPDAVHRMRVATRRLRSAFATFRPLLERDLTDPVREELKWIARLLGEARDAEVMHQRLDDMLASEKPEVVRGTAGTRVDHVLRGRYDRAYVECVEAMYSQRYFALLDRLHEFAMQPPWAETVKNRSSDVLIDRVRHDWKKLQRRIAAVEKTEDQDERARRMHAVRRAAKRVRYAAEPLVPQYGKPAERFVRANKQIQSALGEHQDSVVTQAKLRDLVDDTDTDSAFTFGVLHVREDLVQEETEDRVRAACRRASGKKLRRWLR